MITLDPTRPRARAIGIRAGRIIAVGEDDEVRAAMAGAAAREIDLGGRTAVPGLIDSHVHLLWFGLSLDELAVSGVRSIEELVRRVASAATRQPPGTWITGAGWDQNGLAERRYPSRHDLDRAAPAHPVFLSRACGHVAVANTLALRLAGIGSRTPAPPGGEIVRDESGEPTGLLRENALRLVRDVIPRPPFRRMRDALRSAIRAAQAAGLCGVHTDDLRTSGGLAATLRMYREVLGDGQGGALPFRVHAHVDGAHRAELWESGLRSGDGDPWLRIGAVKLFADGSLGGRTAALRAPYADDPTTSGMLVWPEDELFALVDESHRRGMQVAVHAIGDRGAELAIRAIAAAMRRTPRPDPRHRLVHCQVLSDDLIAAMARQRVVADIQPRFVATDMAWADGRLGPERARFGYAWRTLIRSGVACAGGSDCPIEPIDPILGIFAAVARQDMEGRPPGGWHPAERLTFIEALSLFTLGAAYCAFEENERGSLRPGKLGDVTVLDGDPEAMEPAELRNLRVALTIVGGHVVYAA